MDDLQAFVEQRVSRTVLDKLQTSHLVNAARHKDQDNIKTLISTCVNSAFQEYRANSDPQQGRIIEIQEDADEADGPWDARDNKIEDTSTLAFVTTPTATMSPNASAISLTSSEMLTYSATSEYWSSITDETSVSRSPERMEATEFYTLPSTIDLQDPSAFLGPQLFPEQLWLPAATHVDGQDASGVSVLDSHDYQLDSCNTLQGPASDDWMGYEFADQQTPP